MIILILFLGFQEIGNIDVGVSLGAESRVICGDFDRDGYVEISFYTYDANAHEEKLYFFEYKDSLLLDTVIIDTLLDAGLWYIGDLDLDGLYDLVIGVGNIDFTGFSIFESPDSFSLPLNEVWRDTIYGGPVVPISVFDVDKDSLPEIFQTQGSIVDEFWVYESTGNNDYSIVFKTPLQTWDGITSSFAFGDFDSDGKVEFVYGADECM